MEQGITKEQFVNWFLRKNREWEKADAERKHKPKKKKKAAKIKKIKKKKKK